MINQLLLAVLTVIVTIIINLLVLAPIIQRDYQIEITDDSTYIYNRNRLVAVIPFDSTQTIDKIFLKDNE